MLMYRIEINAIKYYWIPSRSSDIKDMAMLLQAEVEIDRSEE